MKLALAVLLCAGTVHADYRLDSPAWNGLSRLADEAQALGCKISASDELDWARLGPRDVLFILYPLSPVDPGALAAFLQKGGRLLLADDFGTAEPAFATLELRRATAHLDGVSRMDGHPELPVAHARLLTELGRSVSELVANKPAVFDTALPPTFAFSAGQALVVEGRVGAGRFVALADPSVLINNMLEVEGNRVFARALLGELCRSGTDGDRVHVLTGAFQTHAPPRSTASEPGLLPRLNEVFATLNRAADELAPELALPLSVLLCGLAAWLAWASLKGRRLDRHVDGRFVRPDRITQLGAQALVAAVADDGDHVVALMLLRGEVLRRLGAALGPIAAGGPRRALVQRVHARFGAETSRAIERFFATGPPEPLDGVRVSARTFDEALALARPFLATAPLSEDKA